MSSFTVTNKAIVNLLIRKSEQNNNLVQFDEQDAAYDQAIQNILKTIDVRSLRDPDYVLNTETVKMVINATNLVYAKSDGDIVDPITADREKANFTDKPRTILISDSLLDKFLKEVDAIDVKNHFANHELALRIYFGHEKSIPKRTYGALMVPICSPIVATGVKRDHGMDKENSLFLKHEKYFALMITDGQKSIESDLEEWKNSIANKDELTNVELAYYTFDKVKKFRDGTDLKRRKKMGLSFSRKDGTNQLSCIISYYDLNDALLESDSHKSGLALSGTFFDQGDLIPPPPVSDRTVI